MYEHGGNIHGFETPMVDFSANINPLGIPEKLRIAWIEQMKEVTSYPDPAYRKLKKAIADHHFLSEKADILLGNGAVDLIHSVIKSVRPQEVLIPSPAFSEYRNASIRNEIPYREALLYDSLGNLQMEKFLKAVRDRSLVFLCNPNNPTGKALKASDLEQILKKMEETGSFLVLDETFLPFVEVEKRHSLLEEEPENVLFLRALTKIYGIPGVRLGYGILYNEILAKKMISLQEPWHINTFADIAGQVVLKDTEYLLETASWLKNEKAFLYQELSKVPWLTWIESDCNFILVKSSCASAEEIQKNLLVDQILIRLPYGFNGLTSHHFRIAVKDRSSNLKLMNALQKIKDIT